MITAKQAQHIVKTFKEQDRLNNYISKLITEASDRGEESIVYYWGNNRNISEVDMVELKQELETNGFTVTLIKHQHGPNGNFIKIDWRPL